VEGGATGRVSRGGGGGGREASFAIGNARDAGMREREGRGEDEDGYTNKLYLRTERREAVAN